MLGAGRFIAIAVTVFVVWRIVCRRRNGGDLLRETVIVLLFGWSLVVGYLCFFPMKIIYYDWHGTVSLIPLTSSIDLLMHSDARTVLTNLGGNVLLFVPFGVLLPVLFEKLRRPWPLIWRMAVVSAAIEIAQIPTQVRATDVDDVILNVIGALVGLAIFRVVWALVGRVPRAASSLERLGSAPRREPLLIAAVPVVITAVLTFAALAPSVIAHTSSEKDVLRDATSGLNQGVVVARADVGGYAFLVARGRGVESEALRCSTFKRVLPGRFTLISASDVVRKEGSGYTWGLTAYNSARGERPLVVVWGRNDSGATSLVLRIRGQSSGRSVEIGRYFVAAFPYDVTADVADDGIVNDLRFAFVDPAGRDVTRQFAVW